MERTWTVYCCWKAHASFWVVCSLIIRLKQCFYWETVTGKLVSNSFYQCYSVTGQLHCSMGCKYAYPSKHCNGSLLSFWVKLKLKTWMDSSCWKLCTTNILNLNNQTLDLIFKALGKPFATYLGNVLSRVGWDWKKVNSKRPRCRNGAREWNGERKVKSMKENKE